MLRSFQIFSKFAAIFARRGAPLVSTTLVANLKPVDTGGKFATRTTGVNYTGSKFEPVSTTSAENLSLAPLVSLIQVASNGKNIRLLTP
jgi:hypothetical protein